MIRRLSVHTERNRRRAPLSRAAKRALGRMRRDDPGARRLPDLDALCRKADRLRQRVRDVMAALNMFGRNDYTTLRPPARLQRADRELARANADISAAARHAEAVDAKRAMLADPKARAATLAALGGQAGVEAWERRRIAADLMADARERWESSGGQPDASLLSPAPYRPGRRRHHRRRGPVFADGTRKPALSRKVWLRRAKREAERFAAHGPRPVRPPAMDPFAPAPCPFGPRPSHPIQPPTCLYRFPRILCGTCRGAPRESERRGEQRPPIDRTDEWRVEVTPEELRGEVVCGEEFGEPGTPPPVWADHATAPPSTSDPPW